MKRMISCYSSERLNMNKEELKKSIIASEGRVVMTETVCTIPPLFPDLSNAEFAVAFGSDLVLLNCFDFTNPQIMGLPENDNPIKLLKKYIGRPVGCNLEPIDESATMMENRKIISSGRHATVENFEKANELGLDFVCLTGNPGTGVSNESIKKAIKIAKEHFNGLIIAGKMHSSGINEELVNLDSIKEFIHSGADVILLPAINTVPGVSEELLTEACKLIRKEGALSLSAIGTSQESSDQETIREMAIINKRCGFDIQHIGDAGYAGIALLENITTLSIAVRGKRWTYHTMAASINR